MDRVFQDFVNGCGVTKGNKSKSSRSARGGVFHDHDFGQVTKWWKVFPDRLRRCLPTQAPNKHFARVVGDVIAPIHKGIESIDENAAAHADDILFLDWRKISGLTVVLRAWEGELNAWGL